MAIIIRQTDTQTLTPTAARGQALDLGAVGDALAQQGSNIAQVATRLYAQQNALAYQQEQVAAKGKLAEVSSILDNRLNQYSATTWNQNHILKGDTPVNAVKAFDQTISQYLTEVSQAPDVRAFQSNPAFQQGFATLQAQTREKFNLHALTTSNASFKAQQQTLLGVNIERKMQAAIAAGESGGYQALTAKALEVNTLIDEATGTLLTPQEAAKRKQELLVNLQTQWGYNRISAAPEVFYQEMGRGAFSHLTPEMQFKMTEVADSALQRRTLSSERVEKDTLKRHGEEVTRIKTDLIARAVGADGEPDPVGALNQLDRPEMRDAVGADYLTIRDTLITIQKGGSTVGDKATYELLSRETNRHPSKDTLTKIEKAFHRGLVTQTEYDGLAGRTVSGIQRNVDKAHADRRADTLKAIEVQKQLLKTTGIQDFDGNSEKAQGLFEEALWESLNADTQLTLNPFIEARRLAPHFFPMVQDGVLAGVDTLKTQYPTLKTQAQVEQALREKRIEKGEANLLIWALDPANERWVTPAAPTTSTTKPKVGAYQ
jgi:hypothetical protein